MEPTYLPESVVDDLGFYDDPCFNSFESTRYNLDFRSFSSGSNSPFMPKEQPIVVPQPMADVHLIPGVNIRSKTKSLCDPDACSLSPPMSNLKMISLEKTYSSSEHYGINCGELRLEIEEMGFLSIHSKSNKRTLGGMSGTSLRIPDHVLSERNRREKLSQLFVTLSAVIPGLKKLDKASVLEDAIKYIKELKDRVKALEEGHTMNSMVSSKRSRLESYDGNLDCSLPPFDGCNRSLPEVTVRVSHKHVLLKIHCEKHQGRIMPIFNEIGKLNLTILSHGVLSLGNSIMDITVVAEMDVNFSLTIDDLTRNLHQALIDFA